jgi:putative membrane protein
MTILPGILALPWVAGAQAHGAHAHQDAHLAWTWEPAVLIAFALCAGLYLLGWRRMRREGAAPRVLGRLRPLSFGAGMLAMAAALVSPLDALAEQLFSAHMSQHLLLMLVAPPLLVCGRPVLTWLWAFPLAQRRRIGRWWKHTPALHGSHDFMMRPPVVWILASVALWFWHIPGPYDWALASEAVHTVEHLCFFLTSLAFWTLTLEPYSARRQNYGTGLIMVMTFAMHNGLLGALLTFAPTPLYRAYATPVFGLSPLEDQQLAGLIMWVPASIVHLATLAALFVGWLSGQESYAPRSVLATRKLGAANDS